MPLPDALDRRRVALMRILAGVVGVYFVVDMTWAGRLFFAVTVGLPVALEFHARGMARVDAYERRRRSS
jgi:hypothetical protein